MKRTFVLTAVAVMCATGMAAQSAPGSVSSPADGIQSGVEYSRGSGEGATVSSLPSEIAAIISSTANDGTNAHQI